MGTNCNTSACCTEKAEGQELRAEHHFAGNPAHNSKFKAISNHHGGTPGNPVDQFDIVNNQLNVSVLIDKVNERDRII